MEKKKKYDLYFTPYTKINFRGTVILKIKSKIKLLENNTEYLHVLKVRQRLKGNKNGKHKVRFLNQTSLKCRLSSHHIGRE